MFDELKRLLKRSFWPSSPPRIRARLQKAMARPRSSGSSAVNRHRQNHRQRQPCAKYSARRERKNVCLCAATISAPPAWHGDLGPGAPAQSHQEKAGRVVRPGRFDALQAASASQDGTSRSRHRRDGLIPRQPDASNSKRCAAPRNEFIPGAPHRNVAVSHGRHHRAETAAAGQVVTEGRRGLPHRAHKIRTALREKGGWW